MRLLILTPAKAGSTRGNRITANRWQKILIELGHQTVIKTQVQDLSLSKFDALITLHATRSFDGIQRFKEANSNRPVYLCITGTDLYRDLSKTNSRSSERALAAMSMADHLIFLEPEGIRKLPKELQGKTSVIYQSASPVRAATPPLKRSFEMTILGHLRPEKDPFLAAKACELLPEDSKIKVFQLGEALSTSMASKASRLSDSISRYQWLGSLPHGKAMRRLKRSKLMLLTSLMEGAPSVISEAVVNGVPILASKIPATIGLLGSNYPGLFPVGDAKCLAKLMSLAESDRQFFASLKQAIHNRRGLFKYSTECQAWKKLLGQAKT